MPNAVLVTEKVKNWTLHNNTGRFPIRVAVHYQSDPEKVRDTLLAVARDHPQVLASPEPFVYLDEFGPHSLNFVLYVYLANVSRSQAVRTDLRIAILKAFRAGGIEIPYPQADVHLRDLRWVRRMIAERMGPPQNGGAVTRKDFEAESDLSGDNDDDGD